MPSMELGLGLITGLLVVLFVTLLWIRLLLADILWELRLSNGKRPRTPQRSDDVVYDSKYDSGHH